MRWSRLTTGEVCVFFPQAAGNRNRARTVSAAVRAWSRLQPPWEFGLACGFSGRLLHVAAAVGGPGFAQVARDSALAVVA